MKRTIGAIILSCWAALGCGSETVPQQDAVDPERPTMTANWEGDTLTRVGNPVGAYIEINEPPKVQGKRCPLERGEEVVRERGDLFEYAAEFSYTPAEALFDTDSHYWGKVVPVGERITFTDETKKLEDLDLGQYVWEVDGRQKGAGEFDEANPIPSIEHVFEREGWHAAKLSVEQIKDEEENRVRNVGSMNLRYFNVVSQTEGNWHPVPIIDQNYAFHAGYRDVFDEDNPFGTGPLADVRAGMPVHLHSSWSYDLEDFGRGYDCNGIAQYSLCVAKVGEQCEVQHPHTGELELTFTEPGEYTFTLGATDFDGNETSKTVRFEVQE